MCSGSISPLYIFSAFRKGADGVLVSGCHPGDCHYIKGNYYARRRIALVKELLEFTGLEPERFQMSWVSAAEGKKYTEIISDFVDRPQTAGPAEDAQEGSLMVKRSKDLREEARRLLDEEKVKYVVAWRRGPDGLTAAPFFARKPEDAESRHLGPHLRPQPRALRPRRQAPPGTGEGSRHPSRGHRRQGL